MRAAAHTTPASSCPADTSCAHCGLPVGTRPVGTDPFFCCSGCELVYATLQGSGLGETFYRLRDQSADTRAASPASTEVDQLLLSELDSENFLIEHTRTLDDGLRATDLFLDGVHCAACVWLVERLPYELDGVAEARLDLPRARLSLLWDPARVALSDVARWLARIGYTAHPRRQHPDGGRTETERRLLRKVGVCWALAGNVMLLAIALYAGLGGSTDAPLARATRWTSLFLALPAVLYGGSEFFRRAWASLRSAYRARDGRLLHMDTPISAGILIGFGHSAWSTVTGRGEIWFDSITVLIAALLTARWLQLRSRRFASEATERLLALIPTMARRILPDGRVDVVRSAEVRVDDLVEVPAGEVIPVDGSVASGVSSINNAVLTGESRPQRIEPGSAVSAGATNLSAPVQVRVAASGEQTRIGSLLAWIQDAPSHRAPVVLLAHRLTGYFVLSVLVLATATALVWSFLDPSAIVHHTVALLVITCPCALGMATPLAMAVAAGRAARRGLFIKTDEATQVLAHVDCVVLDKTGTLTEGRMSLVRGGHSERALFLAGCLETHSNHPIGRALVEAARIDEADVRGRVSSVESVSGNGLSGIVDGHRLVVGRPDWVRARSAPLTGAQQTELKDVLAAALTPVLVSVDGRVEAVLAFGDPVRADAAPLLDRLRADGKDIYLLSGDHPRVVEDVARRLRIPADHAHGQVTPEEKRTFVERLLARGRTVSMVGDGVNDAAALQAADVGIAVHGGSTASLVAADVFLTRQGVQPLEELFTGAERVMRVIRRNLGLSLVYNVLGAGAAMAGFVSPLVAAVAMPISSLLVVLSSVAQRSFPREPSVRSPHMTTGTAGPAPSTKPA